MIAQMTTPETKQENVKEFLSRFEEICYNEIMTRSAFFEQILDRRAQVDSSCGYPPAGSLVPIETYRQLFDRMPIANRVVNIWPAESWQVQPEIMENEEKTTTDFEQGWADVCRQVQSEGVPNYYNDTIGSAMWNYLLRADILSGIGSFGIILLGIADGKLLEQPVDGAPPDGNPYIVPNIVSGGMPQGARVMPGAFGGQAGVDEKAGLGLGAEGSSKSIYGNPQSELALLDPQQWTMMDEYASVSRDIYGGATSQPLSSVIGTDAQYRGMQFTPGFFPSGDPYGPLNPYAMPTQGNLIQGKDFLNGKANGKAKAPANNLLFIRCFDEALVQVVQYEADLRNPRFGQPIMYLVTLNDPRYPHTGIGLPLATLRVHWSRVVHLHDSFSSAVSSIIYSMPRQQPVLNQLLDLRKLYGGSAEMYWQGALPGLSFETNPQLGGDVKIDVEGMKDMIRRYTEGLQRYLQLTGMTARTLSPTVVDPSNQIQVHIEAICMQLRVPKRIFMGSERGELASSQDDAAWGSRLRSRQVLYISPRIISPLINHLVMIGILPKPKGFMIQWPDMESQTEMTKATIAVQKTQAMSVYATAEQGGITSMMTPEDYMTDIMGFSQEKALILLKNANDRLTKIAQEQWQQQMQMQEAGGAGGPKPDAGADGGGGTQTQPLPPEEAQEAPSAASSKTQQQVAAGK